MENFNDFLDERGKLYLRLSKALAIGFHHNQKWGELPYTDHLERVVALVSGHTLKSIAWLHDILEDTECNKDILGSAVPMHIISSVEFCTDPPGETRRIRKDKQLEVWSKYSKDSPEYVINGAIVKAADRIVNISYSVLTENEKMKSLYKEEHTDFCNVLGNILPESWNNALSTYGITLNE